MRTRTPSRRSPAPNLKAILQSRLSAADKRDRRIAVLGVGSTLRGDDAVGLLAARELTKRLAQQSKPPAMAVFLGETTPENLTGPIKEFRPTCLIIVDAVDAGTKPGQVALVDPATMEPGAAFSTHSGSLRLLIDYLMQFMPLDVVIIGIQPQSLEFGRSPSSVVRKAAKGVAEAIAAMTTS